MGFAWVFLLTHQVSPYLGWVLAFPAVQLGDLALGSLLGPLPSLLSLGSWALGPDSLPSGGIWQTIQHQLHDSGQVTGVL